MVYLLHHVNMFQTYLFAACDMCLRLQIHQDLREDLAKVKTLQGLAGVSKQLRLRCQVTANISVVMLIFWFIPIVSTIIGLQDLI